jgi:hypothetical protein
MTTQIILTVLIVGAATGIAIYRIVKYLKNPLRECDGCGMNCTGCSLEELKNSRGKKGSDQSL